MKPLPHDYDIERACLITAVMNRQSLLAVLELLTGDDFYNLPNNIIFCNIKKMHELGKPIDMLALKMQLVESKTFEQAGGIKTLNEIFSGYGFSYHTQYYIETLRNYTKRRKALRAADKLKDAADLSMNCDIVLDNVESEIRELRHEKMPSFKTVDKVLENGLDGLQKKGEYLKTGLQKLDNKIIGLFKSNLIVVAGRPSTGKTSLVLNIALNLAKEGERILFFSVETPAKRLVMRMLTMEAEIEMGRMLSGHCNSKEIELLNSTAGKVKGLPIMINDDASLGLSSIVSIASIEHQKNPLSALAIDYLQLMKSNSQINRNLGLAEVTAGLKNLSKELDVPVILLSQLSRAVEIRNPPVPILSDLRDSGGIEQDADLVIFTYESEPRNLIVAKNRDGSRGKVPVCFEKRYMKFGDREQLNFGGS